MSLRLKIWQVDSMCVLCVVRLLLCVCDRHTSQHHRLPHQRSTLRMLSGAKTICRFWIMQKYVKSTHNKQGLPLDEMINLSSTITNTHVCNVYVCVYVSVCVCRQDAGWSLDGWAVERWREGVYFWWWWWWGGRWVKEGVQGQEVVGGISDIPSCASAAVLVVAAAGLVCCRPTIGQERHSVGRGQTVRRRGLVECLLTYLYFCPLSHWPSQQK